MHKFQKEISTLGLMERLLSINRARFWVLEERESVSSVIIASQLPFQEWHSYLGGRRNADAIKDRLLNSSYKFELAGPSLRERTCMSD